MAATWCFSSQPKGARVCMVLSVCYGKLFSVAHGVVPRLLRAEKDELLKFDTDAASNTDFFPHPHGVKYLTEWSGLDAPLFNPSCIIRTTRAQKGDGLCITRYGGQCFQPQSARKPTDNRSRFYYGLANYTLGAPGHQVPFRHLSIPENVVCGNDGHPRWFYFNEELYVISWSEECPQAKRATIPLSQQESWGKNEFKNWIWKFGTNGSSFLHWDGYVDPTDNSAKNFLPFQHQDKLLAIVSTIPHRVYQIDVTNGNMQLIAETHTEMHWNSVGLSAGPVKLDDRRLLVAAHIRAGRRMFFYTCEAYPPFKIIEETPLVYFTGNSTQRIKRKAFFLNLGKNLSDVTLNTTEIEYVVQMQILGDELMLSMGIDDCDAAIITVPLSSVTSLLKPIGWMEAHGRWKTVVWTPPDNGTVTASSS